MSAKTHKTALVLLPPRDIWPPIQAIRERYDRQVRRWMPHVTLVYPFRPREEFDAVASQLAGVCRAIQPFELTLAVFQDFHHGHSSFTLWLEPEPKAQLERLHDRLWRVVPDCDDVRRHAGGFSPHLSVGQVRGRPRMLRLKESLQAQWEPKAFRALEIALIYRGEPPHDAFRVDRTLLLG